MYISVAGTSATTICTVSYYHFPQTLGQALFISSPIFETYVNKNIRSDLQVIALSKRNSNAAEILTFLHKLAQVHLLLHAFLSLFIP
jgi:hypothetical protein